MTNLPTPSAAALEHSNQLLDVVRRAIAANGGYISFARYMELVLYAPGLGYYSAGSHKLGKSGDFITAPEISSLFAKCIARQCQQILKPMSPGDILEIGAGTGKFAADLLLELQELDSLPQYYYILEISADLRAKQNHLLETTCPNLLPRVRWLNTLPKAGFQGVIFANEVLDAIPTHCFQIDSHKVKERCVTLVDDQLAWLSAPPTVPELTHRVVAIENESPMVNGYESEINLLIPAWINSIADVLQDGVILLFDYGYGRREYYHPDRSTGTLMCFYQHRNHSNPFILPGLQDISTHVDFTSVAESALDANLQLSGYTTQAAFLLACGIIEIASAQDLSRTDQFNQNQAIKVLTLPSEMGELIKVMALSKNFEEALLGFSLYDRRRDL
jgi:SAM-dependent MidA family methyltransferase